MANISLTTDCNRNCSFCFARNVRNQGRSDISEPVFFRALTFLKDGGVETVRLMGGEPTLHTQFLFFIDATLEQGLNVQVFTGGVISESILDALVANYINDDALHFVLNVDLEASSDGKLLHHQEKLCQRFGKKVTLGTTIMHSYQNTDRLTELRSRWGTAPTIRLGVAQPIAKGGARFVREPQLSNVGALTERFCRNAIEKGINVDFDCGWTPCMFSSDFMGTSPFAKQIGPRCNPVIDILPDGDIIPCYALSHLNCANLQSDKTRDAMVTRFETELQPWREVGSKPECSTCTYRHREICCGGCVARAMMRAMSCQQGGAEA